ncbi:MAG TPA: hypothetical protein VI542_09585, partial [Candidatus Tectomicrobia bacterium]
ALPHTLTLEKVMAVQTGDSALLHLVPGRYRTRWQAYQHVGPEAGGCMAAARGNLALCGQRPQWPRLT